MIKTIIVSLVSFMCFYAQAQQNFTYSVELKQPKVTKASLLLVEYELGGVRYTDSLLFGESVNVITKSLAQPVAASIRLLGSADVKQVFLANNVLSISNNQGELVLAPYVLEREFLSLSQNDRIRAGYFPLYGELNARNDSVGLKKLSVIFDSLRQNDIEKAKSYFDKNNNSLLSLYAFSRFASFSGDYTTLENDYALLQPWAKESPDGKLVRAKINGAIAAKTGVTAKNFEQRSSTNDLIKLSDFKGKYVLLDFWASWCGPCRKEHPDLVKAYAQFKAYDFEIISISLDNIKSAWLKAIEKDGLTWSNVSDLKGMQNEVAILYGVQSIPANFLIDPQGTIVYKNLSGRDLLEILSKNLVTK